MPPKGTLAPYDPENYDESFAAEYGGYTFIEVAGGGGGRGGRGGPRFVGCTSTKTTYCSTDSKGCVAAAACQIMFRIGTACWVFHILYPSPKRLPLFLGICSLIRARANLYPKQHISRPAIVAQLQVVTNRHTHRPRNISSNRSYLVLVMEQLVFMWNMCAVTTHTHTHLFNGPFSRTTG